MLVVLRAGGGRLGSVSMWVASAEKPYQGKPHVGLVSQTTLLCADENDFTGP